tara:strand:+ start:4451 stop:5413 length:963 start_codon:yes stop_codon:yes gene_type:complete
MNTCTIDCIKIDKLDPPKDNSEFKKVRDFPQVFKNGVTNNLAKDLNFQTAKELLPNIKVTLGHSLCDKTGDVIECMLYDYIDYCISRKPLSAIQFNHQEGIPRNVTFTNEPIYLFQMNGQYNKSLLDFVQCPSYIEDWFKLYLPSFSRCVVDGSMHTWFFIGPENTKTEMHNDHDFVHTTIQQLDGEKRFFLISPKDYYFVTAKMGDNYFDDITFESGAGKFTAKTTTQQDVSILQDVKLYTAEIKKHDVIYLPAEWGHYANSSSASISVSRDFIDDRNIDQYFFSASYLSRHIPETSPFIPSEIFNSIIQETESKYTSA